MQHTLAAVFNKQSQAQEALEDLVSLGLSRDEIHLSQGDDASQAGTTSGAREARDDSFGSGFRAFFSDLFGSDRDNKDAELYSEAVQHGHYVLTATVPDDDLVELATDVLERHDPVDIEEQATQWRGGWSGSESMRQSSAQNLQSAGSQSGGSQSAGSQSGSNSQNVGYQSSASQSGSQSQSEAIPVIQEELKIGKRQVQRGGVRIYQRVTERPAEENVSLREERVVVERNPVDQPASAADLAALKEGTIEVREMVEEPVVEKTARVVEEVRVGKEVSERQEQVRDTVRGTEVEVEKLAGGTVQPDDMEDTYYRTHWDSNYAGAGGLYEDYLPAYQYGGALAGNDRYRGRDWDEIEPDVRTGWESRYPESAWERFKAAVRHGWDRITS